MLAKARAVLPDFGPLAPCELQPAAFRDKRAAGPKLEPDMMPVRPVIQELRSKLGTIVDGDAPREAAVSPRGGQDARHVPTREGRGGSDGHAFACVHVQHRQDPHRAPVAS